MILIEGLQWMLLFVLCVIASGSDIKEGLIHNRLLASIGACAIVMDTIYFAAFSQEMLKTFLLNTVLNSLLSVLLFYTRSIAGGDCKMLIVISLLYPARYYLEFNGSIITLFYGTGVAILYGYLYLLATAAIALMQKKNTMSGAYIRSYFKSFIISFLCAMVYISCVNLLAVAAYNAGIVFWMLPIKLICIAIAWMSSKFQIFRNRVVLGVMVAIDAVLSVGLRVVPFSLNPENYVLVVLLLLCQMTIKTNLYEEIPMADLKKGMILSMPFSAMLQNSRIKDLPGISAEDLRNRLTDQEAESVKRWGKIKKKDSVVIVKKIPFAVFLSLGYFTYFIIGSTVR